MTQRITLMVNDREYLLEVAPSEILLNVIRDRLQLTGTKYGCGLGECGACTVLVDGRAILSCQTLAVSMDGRSITTIEGISDRGGLHPLQQAFISEGAIQCGFCTPGMILAAKALLDRTPDPTMDEIRIALRGNFCRCTGYVNIFNAVRRAADIMKGLET
jgi:aerobic-type carbon monoxide dehydrogenase small subunit (CoxS/CutS family)